MSSKYHSFIGRSNFKVNSYFVFVGETVISSKNAVIYRIFLYKNINTLRLFSTIIYSCNINVEQWVN